MWFLWCSRTLKYALQSPTQMVPCFNCREVDIVGIIIELKFNYHLQWSALKKPLPANVHMLTLEQWVSPSITPVEVSQILLRFEHIYEKDEDPVLSLPATVNMVRFSWTPLLWINSEEIFIINFIEEARKVVAILYCFSARNEWNVPYKKNLKSLTLLPFVTFYGVFFQTDFTTFKIEAMRELTLGANLPLSELNRLPWRYIPGKYKWKL